MAENKQVSFLQTIAVMAIFFTAMGVAAVSPAMAKFAAQFPQYNYALVSTMPTLTMVPTTLWAGKVAGVKVRYRTLSLAGIVLFLVGGLVPFFWTSSFYGMIACRAVFGVGAGLRASLGNALVLQVYPKHKQADYLGYGTLVMNAGGIAFQMAGGALAEIGWNYTFLAYLFGFLSLITVFFQPEPAMKEAVVNTKEDKSSLPAAVYIVAVLFFIYNLLNYPSMMNMSLIFEAKNAGGATVAATALSLYTVGGCITGLLFGKIFGVLKKTILPLGYLVAAAGAGLLYFGTNAVLLSCGAICLGVAFALLSTAGYSLLSMYVPARQSAFSISFVMALNSLGGFICPYYLQAVNAIFHESLFTAVMIQMIIYIGFAVAFVFINPYPRKPKV